MCKIVSILLLTLHLSASQAQSLNAELSEARLLSPRSGLATVYDGEETIYIFGGLFFDPDFNLIPYADIHAYNITADTIAVVGELPRTAYDGHAFLDPESGDIFYLRGDGTFLWRYNPATGNTTSESEWLGGNGGNTLVFTPDRKFTSFGGLADAREIYQLDLVTLEQGLIGRLPQPTELSVGIYSPEDDITFLFVGELGNREPILMVYDHAQNRTIVYDTVFPSWRHGDGSPIWTGDSVLILGAVVDNGARGNGAIRFGKDSREAEYIPVEGLEDELTSTSAVWVEGLNRVYLFGGYDIRNLDTDRIWWIDLN